MATQLPRFTGNYNPRGAYESNQPIGLDKSGEILAKGIQQDQLMQQEQQQAAFKKENDMMLAAKKIELDNFKFGETQKEKLLWQLGRSGINNNSFYETGYNLINSSTKWGLQVKNAKSPEERKFAMERQDFFGKKLGEFLGLANTMKGAVDTYTEDGYLSGNTGGQGQVATVGKPYTNTYNFGMPALMGLANNSNSQFYMDESGTFRIRMQSDQIKKGYKDEKGNNPGYIDQQADIFLTYDPGMVPKVKDQFMKTMYWLEDNGKVKDEFLNLYKRQTRKEGDFKITEDVLQTELVNQMTKKQKDAIIDSYLKSDPDGAQIIYQQILGNSEPLQTGIDGLGFFDLKSEQAFRSGMESYYDQLLPKNITINKEEIEIEEPGENSNKDIAQSMIDTLQNGTDEDIRKFLGSKNIMLGGKQVTIIPGQIKVGKEIPVMGPVDPNSGPIKPLTFKTILNVDNSGVVTTDLQGAPAEWEKLKEYNLADKNSLSTLISELLEGSYTTSRKNEIKDEVRKILGEEPSEKTNDSSVLDGYNINM